MITKMLVVFDFDDTLIHDDVDVAIFNLLAKGQFRLDMWQRMARDDGFGSPCFLNEVLACLFRQGCTKQQIKDQLHKIRLNKGMSQLLRRLRKMPNVDCVIISDSNTFFIRTILNHYGFEEMFDDVISNRAETDATGKIRIYPCHGHYHDTCPRNMCKGLLLREHRMKKLESGVRYKNVVYVGDGLNDLCPCSDLASADCVCARWGYPLAKKLTEDGFCDERANCAQVVIWRTGADVMKKIVRISVGKKPKNRNNAT